ncbi:MAG: DUF2887 domain-containing protein [Hydrococcus sp. SU_1_0]|nr:DUF2887 domain-containing protein [Hydrococcus sp. SU_1_0]
MNNISIHDTKESPIAQSRQETTVERSFRLDGLFTTAEEYSDQPLYFVEVQFYQETDFYDRPISQYFSLFQPI